MARETSIPAISVVMSVYNGADYVRAAIDSILCQTFEDFEFIIIDDGSTDSSPRILEEAAQRDGRVVIVHQENTGLTIALRRGIEMAKAPIIARMDADDISEPDRLREQYAHLLKSDKAVAVTCYLEHFNDEESRSSVIYTVGPPEIFPLFNCFANRIGGHGQMVFRKSVIQILIGICFLAAQPPRWGFCEWMSAGIPSPASGVRSRMSFVRSNIRPS